MLIISRKAGQGFVAYDLIDNQGNKVVIGINVLSIDGDRVKVGIEAPASVSILRAELLPEDDPFYSPRRPS